MHFTGSHTLTISATLIALIIGLANCASHSDRFLYSMGLGKRVYSPYSFGLGKRSGGGDLSMANRDTRARHVFSFGLGKRDVADEEAFDVVPLEEAEYDNLEEEKRGGQRTGAYSFGLGKRADSAGRSFYSFGLGKRNVVVEEGKSPLVTVNEVNTSIKEKEHK